MAVGLVGVLTSLLVAGLLVAAVALTGQQARTAADLAALAAAGQVMVGEEENGACSAGSDVAARNHAVLLECRVVPTDSGLPRAEVVVGKDVPGTPWTATARAAAGGVPASLER